MGPQQRYDLASLVQIGINNMLIARTAGVNISIYEHRVLDQFAKTTYLALKIEELQMKQELEKYDGFDTYTGKDALDNSDPEGNGNDHQPA